MQLGGVEQGQGAVFGFDQQANLCAAKDDRLGAALLQRSDDLLIHPARGFADDADAQLVVDDPVHGLALPGLRHQHGQAPGGEAFLEEVLFHGERGAQQSHLQCTGLDRSLSGRIGDVQEGNVDGRLNLPGDLVHGVGA
ncbi:hypothetical protein D3C84_769580 [compost metagenome]